MHTKRIRPTTETVGSLGKALVGILVYGTSQQGLACSMCKIG